ncbi:hypothetical protein [Cellulomonas sp. ATA003]|uniref:hypothetical protein n=1 Tax=Cellulomonas sp. ATA003 TaxID=3073064 RepID=UPI002873C965|nr:hypothetical protein [Cellulomonas sp. ATA003]WNB86087.1 hypothetical protein REH70_02025 [Cellulomonas sp. ATA003]
MGDDFTRPTGGVDGTGVVGATTFLGRPAWSVELAPPARKPYPMQVVVDAETGFVLQQRMDAVGAVDEWVELEVGVPLSPSLFSWQGPVRPATSARDAARAAQEADRRRWADWFGDAVGPLERTAVVGVELDLTVQWVHTFDPATGAFEASLGKDFTTATLARRPRSAEPWDLSGAGIHHRWSTADHDWAFLCLDLELTPEGFAAVERLFSGP